MEAVLPDDLDTPLTGELLLESLDKLRTRLNKSGVNRTMGLREHRGRDCAWYMKSLSHFLRQDFRELKELVSECNKFFEECEAEDEQEG